MNRSNEGILPDSMQDHFPGCNLNFLVRGFEQFREEKEVLRELEMRCVEFSPLLSSYTLTFFSL